MSNSILSSQMPAIFHDVKAGMLRLLAAPRDLPGALVWREPLLTFAQASEQHRALFASYLIELRWASALAVPWWNALVQRSIERGETQLQAIRSNYELRPAGPASRPEVVWVVRSFWLQCVAVNAQATAEQRVPPELLLLKWLEVAGHTLLLSVLTGMPFWPIGFDENGEFC
jgi:hypothetical protein